MILLSPEVNNGTTILRPVHFAARARHVGCRSSDREAKPGTARARNRARLRVRRSKPFHARILPNGWNRTRCVEACLEGLIHPDAHPPRAQAAISAHDRTKSIKRLQSSYDQGGYSSFRGQVQVERTYDQMDARKRVGLTITPGVLEITAGGRSMDDDGRTPLSAASTSRRRFLRQAAVSGVGVVGAAWAGRGQPTLL